MGHAEMPEKNLREKINWLDWIDIVELLEGASIACDANDSLETLQEALASNVEDGTISESAIEEKYEN